MRFGTFHAVFVPRPWVHLPMRRLLVFCALALLLYATAASTVAADPAQRHIELKYLMLDLINEARAEAGAPAVSLGTNGAAQLHAEQMVAGCFHGHWGLDGMKPYMRYSLLGGYQANAENAFASYFSVAGTDPCAVIASTSLPDLERLVREAMEGWIDSPGHRRNLLNPYHRLVNIGIAWRGAEYYIFRAVQHFEGDYVRLSQLPSIIDGTLSLSGRIVNGGALEEGLYVRYDLPPRRHQRAVLNATSSYCGGYPIAAVFPNTRWTGRSSSPTCAEPGASGPRGDGSLIELPTIGAEQWESNGSEFAIRADLSTILHDRGAGVYTISLSGEIDGARTTLLEYAIFHGLFPLNRVFVYGAEQTRASALSDLHDLHVVFRWDGTVWRGYAATGGRLVPGAADFTISLGDWIWLGSLD